MGNREPFVNIWQCLILEYVSFKFSCEQQSHCDEILGWKTFYKSKYLEQIQWNINAFRHCLLVKQGRTINFLQSPQIKDHHSMEPENLHGSLWVGSSRLFFPKLLSVPGSVWLTIPNTSPCFAHDHQRALSLPQSCLPLFRIRQITLLQDLLPFNPTTHYPKPSAFPARNPPVFQPSWHVK